MSLLFLDELDRLVCWTAYHWGLEAKYDRSWLNSFPPLEEEGQPVSAKVMALMMHHATFLPKCFLEDEIRRIGGFSLPAGMSTIRRMQLLNPWTEFINLQAGRVLLIDLEKGQMEWIYDPEIVAITYNERINTIRETLLSLWEGDWGVLAPEAVFKQTVSFP